MLDVRRLRLLRELAARGTVTAVAEALAYTPSAVSQQLAALERDAGVPLLERVGRRVRLTDAGRRLVEHADAVIARLEEAEADLAATQGAVAGRMRIAWFQTAAHALVLPALGVLHRRHPDLRAELLQADAEHALPELRLGDVDLVVAEEYDHAPRARDPALDYDELCSDLLVVSVPAGHPAAGMDEIALAALAARVGGRRARHGLERHDHARLPLDRRLRARHPPPRRRRAADPRARRVAAAWSRWCRRSAARTSSRAWSRGRPPTGRSSAGSSPRRAAGRATRPPSAPCTRRWRSRRASSGSRLLVVVVRVGLELVLVLDDLVVVDVRRRRRGGSRSGSTSSSRGARRPRPRRRAGPTRLVVGSSSEPGLDGGESSTTIRISVVGLK